jgi:phosphoribosyl 1,2-cyclic phosphodiesterase
MPLSVRSFGSGSSGNALLIDAGSDVVVVDCGVGARALTAGLRAAGRRLEDVSAVLLTHEHADHVRSLPQVVKARVPLIATPGTARAAGLAASGREELSPGGQISVGAFTVTALAVSHDAVEPCGYHLQAHGVAVTVVTDLGRPDPALHDYLAASDLIVLEANHDEAMLRTGPYPAHLKRRVLSATGHLSNADCGLLLLAALRGTARPPTVWLAHLSTTNNRPVLARQTVERTLARQGLAAPVAPLPRHGHDAVWSPDRRPPVAIQMALPLS